MTEHFLEEWFLTAVGRDANNQMYPIPWGIVTVKNKKNWIWFMERLQQDLGFGRGKGWTFMSDQCKVSWSFI